MSNYYRNTSWSTVLLVILISLSMLLPVGINEIQSSKNYDLPICISKEITISGYSSYTIQGELKNISNKDITIEKLELSAYGSDANVKYHTDANLVLSDIQIAPNATYKIYITDLVYTKENLPIAMGELTKASIAKCVIDGKNVVLKKIDGGAYVSQGGNAVGPIICVVIGGVSILGVLLIIFNKVKRKA